MENYLWHIENAKKVDKFGEIPKRPKGADCKSAGYAFTGSNPVLPRFRFRFISRTIVRWFFLAEAKKLCGGIGGNSSIGRATAFQAVGCGFESRFPLQIPIPTGGTNAGVAQLVEQLICNQQVAGSNPVASSINSKFAIVFVCNLIYNLKNSVCL